MSIWGKRADAWFDDKVARPSRTDYNRAGLNALWQIALVVLIAAAVLLVAQTF